MNAPFCFPTTPPVTSQCFLPVSGGTMFGPLILMRDPVNPLEAATKEYVDALRTIFNLQVTTNATPQNGDLWFDGTHLNFQLGGTTHVIV